MTGECDCPVCGKTFKTPQGRGGHFLHAPDVAHRLYRQQQQLAATRTHATPTARPAPAPVPVPVSAPVAPAPTYAPPVPATVTVALTPLARSSLRSYPGMGWGTDPPAPAPAPPTQASPPSVAPPRISATDFLKPGGAALAGGAVGAALAGPNHRGVGFLFGAGMGLLVWWGIEHRRHAPAAPKRETAPPIAVPKEWQGVLVPGAGWAL